ncbi:MAG TPA: MlaD family protein [Oligoflexia bacterium]|nr:MlaD family protein [Oligoflexia bacterium]
MGKEKQIFARQEEFSTSFKDVKGLAKGAPVRIGGITAGRVVHIGFSKDLNDPAVHVKFVINDEFLERLRVGSSISIETQGLLGDKFLSISPGDKSELIHPGSEITGEAPAEIGEIASRAAEVIESTASIAKNANSILEEFKASALAELNQGVKAFSAIVQQIEKGDGLANRLIYSKEDGQKVISSISKAADDLSAIISEIKTGSGMLHYLVYGEEEKKMSDQGSSISFKLSAALDGLREILDKIKKGNGIMHDLIYGGPESAAGEIISNLKSAAQNLQQATQALAAGTGTLGALLYDAGIYDNLAEILGGAKRSIILRTAIKKSLASSKSSSDEKQR